MNINQEVQNKQKEKKRALESSKKLSDARDEIIDLFEKETFPYKGNVFKTKKEESEENRFLKYIENESKSINYELFKKHYSFVVTIVLAKTKLYETKDRN